MADREWMYTGFKDKTEEWVKGTSHFLERAFGPAAKGAIRVWCPCSKCKNASVDAFVIALNCHYL
jgi:hypothetical protein